MKLLTLEPLAEEIRSLLIVRNSKPFSLAALKNVLRKKKGNDFSEKAYGFTRFRDMLEHMKEMGLRVEECGKDRQAYISFVGEQKLKNKPENLLSKTSKKGSREQ